MKSQFSEAVWKGIEGHIQPLGCTGVEILDVRPGYSLLQMEINDTNVNIYGFAHGGILYTLCDSASGMATYAFGKTNVTLSSSMSYMKSATKGLIQAECNVIHKGRKTAVSTVNIFNEDNDLLATATFTMYLKADVDPKE